MFKKNNKIFIISELSPQNEGDIDALKTMILQSKTAGADAVKIQIYDSVSLLGDNRKEFCEISKQELKSINAFCEKIEIQLLASVFDQERLDWLDDYDFMYNKIASRIHSDDKVLAKNIINKGKITFISNGKDSSDFSFSSLDNTKYLYCVSSYPTLLEETRLPNFRTHEHYVGYSDHSYGLTAVKSAVVLGAEYIEKHFTLSKGMQSSTNKAHFGSMNFKELVELRSFCDDFVRLKIDE